MIAVTGAAFVLSTLPGVRAGRRRALASGVLTNRMRAGHVRYNAAHTSLTPGVRRRSFL